MNFNNKDNIAKIKNRHTLLINEVERKYHIGFAKAYKIWRKIMKNDEMNKENKVKFKYKKNISDKLALGYGSKYQLLRMLGWHRELFNESVSKTLNINNDIKWFDFIFNGSQDKELLNCDFLPSLKQDWQKVWACTVNVGINWDAIGQDKDGTYILLEAKAHIDEIGGNTTKSLDKRIINSINKVMNKYNINAPIENWLTNNYQLANRLVFLDFLKEHGYKAKFLYVFFLNGFIFNTSSPKHESLNEWQDTLNKELTEMGIKGSELEKEVNVLYFNCDVN